MCVGASSSIRPLYHLFIMEMATARRLAGPMLLAILAHVNILAMGGALSTKSATVHVDTSEIVFAVEPHYVSYTIDTSAERGFFERDLSNPKVRWLAKQLAPAILRVGGSGGDQLYYDIPHNASYQCPGPDFPTCKRSGNWEHEVMAAGTVTSKCLNTSQWDALHGFAKKQMQS